MPLPDDFNPWEHLQQVVMMTHNRIVREEFLDVSDDEQWNPEITTPRSSLRVACTILDDDSAVMTEIRMFLFYVILRKAVDLQPAIYGLPVTTFQEIREFKPQIQLYFQENYEDIEPGYAPVTGEISFRLMHESAQTLTQADVERYAERIRSLFATGTGFQWRKGKYMCAYNDRANGYQLQLLCNSQTEAQRVIEQVLDIQGHAPNWKNLSVSENAEPGEAFPTVPNSQEILGRVRRLPRKRPVATVHFKFATLHIWGIPNPITLVDKSGIRKNPVIRAT